MATEYKAAILLALKDSVSKGLSKIGGSLRNTLKAATPASYALLGGMTALTGSIAAFGAYGVKSAMEMEDLRTQFDVMLGSASKGKKQFTDLSKMANITPLDTEDLAAASKTLLGFGIAEKEVLPDMKMIGDVALGNKEKLGGLSLAFAQVQSTGKLTGQDLLQMINNGFNPLEYIAKRSGKSIGQLKEEMAETPISAAQVKQAFVDATSEGGRFYKGMDRGSKTLSGLWSTVKDNFGKVARSVVGLSESGDIVKGSFFDKIKAGALELGKTLTDFSSAVAEKGLVNAIKDMLPPGAIPIIFGIAGALSVALVPALYSVASGFIAATAPLLPFIATGAALGGLAYLIYKNWGKIGPYFTKAWETVKTAFSQFWEWVKPYVNKAIKAISKFIHEELAKIKQFWDENGEQIIAAIKNVWKLIKWVVESQLEFLKSIWERFGPQIIDTAKTMWNGIKDVIDGALDIILGLVKTFSALFTGDWDGVWEGIKQTLGGVWDTIKGIFEIQFASIITSLQTWVIDFKAKLQELTSWEFISTWAENQKTALIAKLGEWASTISEWYSDQREKILEKLNEWETSIKAWFAGMPEKIKAKLNEWADALQQWATDQKARNMEKFKEWDQDIREWFASIPAKIKEKLALWKKSIITWFNNTKESIAGSGGKLEEWWTKISSWFSEIPAKITKKFEEWWEAIKTWFAGVPEKPEVKNAGKKIVDKVFEGSKEKKQEFVDKLGKLIIDVLIAVTGMLVIAAIATGKEIHRRVMEGISGLKTALYNYGRDALQAFWNGLKSKLGSLKRWVERNVKPLLNMLNPWARHSPSLVDQVQSGVKAIQKEYGKLTNLNMPSLKLLTTPSPAFAAASGGVTIHNLNITGNTIASDYDIDRIGDRLVRKIRKTTGTKF